MLEITKSRDHRFLPISLALITHITLFCFMWGFQFLGSAPKVSSQQIIKINFSNPNNQKSVSDFTKKNQKSVNQKSTVNNSDLQQDLVQSEPIFDAHQLNNSAPIYPAIAKSRGISGKVILEVLVSENGEAQEVKISSSSGYAILDNSAIEAVENWHFIPAKKFGNNIQARILIPIEYKII